MSAVPHIDVDTASREKLIAHIDRLEMAVTEAYPSEDDTVSVRAAFGLTLVEGRIVAALSKRGTGTLQFLRIASVARGDEANVGVVGVLMVRIRKKLAPFGIEIKSDYGRGYQLDTDHLQRLRSLISERAAA